MTTTPMTEEQMDKAGAELAKSLGLKKSKEFKDRWVTTWGTKTNQGLYLTLKEMMGRVEKGISL
jgi:hypothetical protein